MWINQLSIQNCRSIKKAALQLSPRLNIVIGENASGKTSLLESLCLLSTGRSFRTSHISEVISDKEKEVIVTAKVIYDDVTSHIGLEKSASKARIRINQQDIFSQAELSRYLPITVIHPDSLSLITGAPSLRRSYLDWIAFYIFPEFHSKWKSYQHILKQRNHCLKNPKYHNSLGKWTEELVSLQPDITRYRKAALQKLKPFLDKSSSKLLKDKKIRITFETGLPATIDLSEESLIRYYQSKLKYDCAIQRTSAGVHKANLKFFIDSKPAESSASRGQLKLLSIALLLSQSATIKSERNNRGILLVDDFTSELDSINKKTLVDYLRELEQQIIITTTRKEIIEGETDCKMFHVKHGVINEFKKTE